MIGVVVRDTSIEIAIATERVAENSRNKRPTIPPISSNGMNTATREVLIASTVNPTPEAPLSAASYGFIPSSI
jgi:hypothetical protein